MSSKKSSSKPAAKQSSKPDAAKQSGDDKLYAALAAAGIVTTNPRTGKRLTKRNLIGHVIQAEINRGPANVAAIAQRLANFGVTENRVTDHVNYWLKAGRLALDKKQNVILTEAGNPNWRTADAVTAKAKTVKPVDG